MRNRPYGFEIYLVNVKTIETIAQIFVAFSEKLNFNYKLGHWPCPSNRKAGSQPLLYAKQDNFFASTKGSDVD